MKKIILFLLPFILIATASAAVQMYIGDTISVGTSGLKVMTIYEDCSAAVQVDNIPPEIVTNISITIGPVQVRATDCFYAASTSFVYIEASYVGYDPNCNIDSDCDDDDPCTLDFCRGSPKRCDYPSSHFLLTECKDGDGCCPTDCDWKIDNDCDEDRCELHEDCDDGNELTNDTCISNICQYANISCYTGDNICPDNCFWTSKIIPQRDNDCHIDNECINHIQCDDNNPATIDSCKSTGKSIYLKYCWHVKNTSFISTQSVPVCGNSICEGSETMDSCPADCKYETVEHPKTACPNIGNISTEVFSEPAYCADSGWILQKPSKVECAENYECLTNECKNNICTGDGLDLSLIQNLDKRILLLGLLVIGFIFYIIVVRKIAKRE